MCMRGQKKSCLKFLLGAEYDSWVIKFERRKHTAFQEIKKSRTKKTDEKSNSRNCFSIFSSKILSQNENSEKKISLQKAIEDADCPVHFGISLNVVCKLYLPEVLSFSAHIVNGII